MDITAPRIVVDSLLHIHMFVVRSRDTRPGHAQPNTLMYYKFDNWGRPLAEPIELLPDTHWIDHSELGVLIDRLDRIHLVWLRVFDESPQRRQLIYVRLSAEGEFLQDPLIFERLRTDPDVFDAATYHLVETASGEIWAGCGSHYFAVDVNGNLVEPPQTIYPIRSWAMPLIASAPDGSVWATFRKTTGTSVDSMKTVRLWPPPRIEETTYVCDNPGFGPQAFTIDRFGSFHYVILSEDSGFFYRFDPRGQGQVVSFVFDSFPYGVGWSDLALIGGDSLQYVWGRTLPSEGINRICFTVGGEIGSGPVFIPLTNFGITDYNTVWRDGGYWIPGFAWGEEESCAMLHIPGPEEPLIAHENHTPSSSTPTLQVYPQPNFGTLNFVLPSTLKGATSLTIYNLLGQQVFQQNLHELSVSSLPGILLPSGLATGTYVLSLSTPNQFLTSRFLLIR